jgi:hypothetical protein
MAIKNTSRLKAAGPIDPIHGFPLWFEDTNGVRLELGLNADPLTPAIGELKKTGEPQPFPENFPDESFYFLAEARLQVGGNGVDGKARVIFALEAAFGGAGTPKKGLNVVFARIRVRMDDLIPGAKYTVTHPYGTIDPEDLTADENGRVFYTEDLGIMEGDGTAVLRSGQVAPFLKWTIPVTNDGNDYIGDGANDHQVTGSPFNTNFVRIEGPRIRENRNNPDPSDPLNQDRVWTDKFTVQGRIAKRLGAWLESATFAKAADGSYLLSVQAHSVTSQNLHLVGTGLHIKLDDEGEFYTGLGRATTLPSDARLVNVTDAPPTSYPVKFTDLVIVESAIYDRTSGTLTIKARSSDPAAALSLPQINELLTSNPQSFSQIAVPSEIIVKSSLGGAGRQQVEVVGNPAVTQPVKAIIAPPPVAIVGEPVTLDGSGSLGATSFTWIQTAGATVTLTGANTAQITFTPSAVENYIFSMTVQDGNGNSANAVQTLVVQPKPAPDVLNITRQDYRTASRQFRIDGTVNQGRVPKLPNVVVVKFFDGKEEEAIPDIDGVWSVRRTLLESETNLVPVLDVTNTAEVRSQRSTGSVKITLRIRN